MARLPVDPCWRYDVNVHMHERHILCMHLYPMIQLLAVMMDMYMTASLALKRDNAYYGQRAHCNPYLQAVAARAPHSRRLLRGRLVVTADNVQKDVLNRGHRQAPVRHKRRPLLRECPEDLADHNVALRGRAPTVPCTERE